MSERFGILPPSLRAFENKTGGGSIWFHAVSVGEVLSAVELIKQVRSEHPWLKLFVSTTTIAGRAMAEQKLAGLADGVFFLPLDYRSAIRRVLRCIRPAMLVVLETEIWPNLYREAKRSGASLVLANGRISDRAMPRYRRFRWFFKHVLRLVDAIYTQTDEDARRFVKAGANRDRVWVGGNLKYDFKPPSNGVAAEIDAFLDHIRPQRIWIAASTMPPAKDGDPDEDDVVIAAHQRLAKQVPGLLLILVPRKPERFAGAAQKLAAAGIPFVRRSKIRVQIGATPSVLLLDSMGELAALFERADVVFMGGTLASRGGHNILEPAYFGKPVIVGPHMENFAAIAAEFRAAGAIRPIDGANQLAAAVLDLLESPGELGARARSLAQSKRGVTSLIAQELWHWYDKGIALPKTALWRRLLLTPLSWLWMLGNAVNRLITRPQALKPPVLSVGGIGMGGVGKSPMVSYLAAKLAEANVNPAILTRGYKREQTEPVIVRRGKSASASETGDEAQIYVRQGNVHTGVGKDRLFLGREIEKTIKPGAFLLDDGFQHYKLKRKFDLVLLDALNPTAGGVFPLGLARETLSAVRRAHAVVFTRVEPGQTLAGWKSYLESRGVDAPVFLSRVCALQWHPEMDQPMVDAPRTFTREPVAAFCGIGNPETFWRTLQALGMNVVMRKVFPDHHAYTTEELQAFAQGAFRAGAKRVVTTQKDLANLPHAADAHDWAGPLKLHWLEIGIAIEREQDLLDLIFSKLGTRA